MSKPHCYNCGEEIVFDKHKIGSKSGKMIPLDPQTREPHSCSQDEQQQAEVEQEEIDYGANQRPEPEKKPAEKEKLGYPKHQVRMISKNSVMELEDAVNTILEANDEDHHLHRGVTVVRGHADNEWIAVIHYEILQPRDQR